MGFFSKKKKGGKSIKNIRKTHCDGSARKYYDEPTNRSSLDLDPRRSTTQSPSPSDLDFPLTPPPEVQRLTRLPQLRKTVALDHKSDEGCRNLERFQIIGVDSKKSRKEKKKNAARLASKEVVAPSEIVTNQKNPAAVSPLSHRSRRNIDLDDNGSEIEDDAPELSWFPDCVALSLLDQRTDEASMDHSMFEPAPQRIVRESCIRHLQLQCLANTTDAVSTASETSAPVDVDAYDRYLNKDTSSMIIQDSGKADQLAREFVQAKNYDGAIAVYKVLLQSYQSEHPTTVIMIARQLALLCLAAGRNREATKFSSKALQAFESKRETLEEAKTTISVQLVHGLTQFGTNKMSQAFRAWREATHMAIAEKGYEDTTVAVLLNFIGVLHYEAGDLKSSIRSLEESLELQRTILANNINSADDTSVSDAIYRMATTMGNLAMACERSEQFDRAIGLLDESIALYESNEADNSEIEEWLQKRIEHILELQREQEGRTKHSTPTTSEEETDDEDRDLDSHFYSSSIGHSGPVSVLTEDCSSDYSKQDDYGENNESSSVDSERSMKLFGNKDGVPNRRMLAAKITMEQADNHDFLLLGRLSPELTTEQRVRETVLTWFGKRVDDDPVITFDLRPGDDDEILRTLSLVKSSPSSKKSQRIKESIPVDLDESNVVNAELHLNEIHKQAMAHLDANEIDDALDLFKSALKSHRKKYGKVHHLVGSSLHNIGMVHFFAKQYLPALSAFEAAVSVRTEALGPEHPDVQSSLLKIALIQLALGDLHKAHDAFWEIRNKLLKVLGQGHPQLAKAFNNVGVVAYEFGDLKNALGSFETAYEYQSRLLEQDSNNAIISLATANSLCNLAFVYSKGGETSEAMEVYERALKILRKHSPSDDHRVIEIRRNMKHLLATSHTPYAVSSQSTSLHPRPKSKPSDDMSCVPRNNCSRQSNPLCKLDFFG